MTAAPTRRNLSPAGAAFLAGRRAAGANNWQLRDHIAERLTVRVALGRLSGGVLARPAMR
jgi:hypothetical protein